MSLRIVSHRGWWQRPDERNSRAAFERAIERGFGIETDLRDALGVPVISHDPPTGGELTLSEFLALTSQSDLPIALNIKADGLAAQVAMELASKPQAGLRAFDMSIPDLRSYTCAGVPCLNRVSELEPISALPDGISGVWLDQFDSTWFSADTVASLRARSLEVWIVSAELHGRDARATWDLLAMHRDDPGVHVCTDYPEELATYLGVRG